MQKHSKQEIVNDICRKADRVKLKKVEKALVLSILENERTDESVNQDLEEKVQSFSLLNTEFKTS